MSIIPPIGANQNQIQIDVSDSCNFCCFRWRKKKIPDDTLVFVNQHGIAVNFNPAEWNNRLEAMTEALANIHLQLARIAEQNAMDKADIDRRLTERNIAPRLGTPVTLRLVRQINGVIDEICGSPSER